MRPIENLASGPALRWVIFGRLLGAVALILFPTTAPIDTICVACVLLCTLVINLRAPLGLDGSDQMTLIVFVAFGVEKAFRSDTHVATVCVWFIALQSCLSYCCAGVAKVISPVWRSGEAIRRVLSTRSYGTETTAKLFGRWPLLCPLIAWTVIGFECAFPLVLVTGPAGFWIFIGWGILFHLLNALIMGLNTFFWAFLATYPAIWFCGRAVAEWI